MELREELISMSESESKAWLNLTQDGNRYKDMAEEFVTLHTKNAE